MALPNGLLEDVKLYLDITWVDTDTDKKLNGIIERGMKYIDRMAGTTLDYNAEDKPKELLLDYCRYVRSNALSEFMNNYLSEILTLQMYQEVKDYETENTDTNL